MKVVVFNGPAEAGKGEVEKAIEKHFEVEPYKQSSIDWAKLIAQDYFGWDGETKTPWIRELLGDLKKLGIKYGDMPTKVLIRHLNWALDSSTKINTFFTDIREPDEIVKFVRYCKRQNIDCVTVRVHNTVKEAEAAESLAETDNMYAGYNYDTHVYNNGSLSDLEEETVKAFKGFFEPRVAP